MQHEILLESALDYARKGWAVFPCHTPIFLDTSKTFNRTHKETGTQEQVMTAAVCSCPDGAFCESKGKHPRTMHGVKDATTDEATIRKWWRMWPDANLAVATGDASGFDVLDIDGEEGEQTLAELESQHTPLPQTLTQITGGGGGHQCFRKVDARLKNRSKFAPGLDIRTTGGYIIVDPSLHESGNEYRWEDSDLEPADMPQWLLDLLPKHDSPQRQSQPTASGATITEGQRNDALFRLGSSMRRSGFALPSIETALLSENTKRCDPPLSEDEVKKIATSAAKYEPALTLDDACSHANTLTDAPAIRAYVETLTEPASWWEAEDFKRHR